MTAPLARRVAIDALAARFGGTAYAVVHLARYLAEHVQAVCVITRAGSIVHRGLAGDERVQLVLPTEPRRLELADRLQWESRRLPALLTRFRATDCFTVAGILPTIVDVAVTSYLLNPVPFSHDGLANAIRRSAIVRTARRGATVVVPTEAMADLVEPHIGRRPTVVPLGIERSQFRPGERAGAEVLVVADFYTHKRHDLVLEAWCRLPEPAPRLRFIGNPGPDEPCAARIRAAIAALDGDNIVVEHHLTLPELAERYRRARAFVIASEHESFSMPLAEALACGVPGVARADPVLRETGGRGCVYVDSDDPADWAAALQSVLEQDELHRSLRDAGLRHAERYSFERMGAELLECMTS
jgi:glycosyltransferase involved in cell wall biosynthesis